MRADERIAYRIIASAYWYLKKMKCPTHRYRFKKFVSAMYGAYVDVYGENGSLILIRMDDET